MFFKPMNCINEVTMMIHVCFWVKDELKIGFLIEKTRVLFFRLP